STKDSPSGESTFDHLHGDVETDPLRFARLDPADPPLECSGELVRGCRRVVLLGIGNACQQFGHNQDTIRARERQSLTDHRFRIETHVFKLPPDSTEYRSKAESTTLDQPGLLYSVQPGTVAGVAGWGGHDGDGLRRRSGRGAAVRPGWGGVRIRLGPGAAGLVRPLGRARRRA